MLGKGREASGIRKYSFNGELSIAIALGADHAAGFWQGQGKPMLAFRAARHYVNSSKRGFAMSTGPNRILDEFAKLMTDAAGAAQGVRREVETAFKGAERILNTMDVVQREDSRPREMAAKACGRKCPPRAASKARGEACRIDRTGRTGGGGQAETKKIIVKLFHKAQSEKALCRESLTGIA
jgi:BMFP domain-containing protein YqiC